MKFISKLLFVSGILFLTNTNFAESIVVDSESKSEVASPVEKIRIRSIFSNENKNLYQLRKDILNGAIKHTKETMGDAILEEYDIHAFQKRLINLIESNKIIDVIWFGTSKEREEKLQAIKIPLNLGLLGKRMMIIHKDNKSLFDNIKTAEELKKHIACQGDQWPGSDILEYNGYKVSRGISIESMSKMILYKRCDYFPRSVFEGYSEVERSNDPNLIAYDRILLNYPQYQFFFVNKDNTKLYNRLKTGIQIMVDNKELLHLLTNNLTTSVAFPISKYKHSLTFELSNTKQEKINFD